MIHLYSGDEVAIVTVIGIDSYTLSRFASWDSFRAADQPLEERMVNGQPTADSLLAEYPDWSLVTRDDGTWEIEQG